jgi:hypothetical protein
MKWKYWVCFDYKARDWNREKNRSSSFPIFFFFSSLFQFSEGQFVLWLATREKNFTPHKNATRRLLKCCDNLTPYEKRKVNLNKNSRKKLLHISNYGRIYCTIKLSWLGSISSASIVKQHKKVICEKSPPVCVLWNICWQALHMACSWEFFCRILLWENSWILRKDTEKYF